MRLNYLFVAALFCAPALAQDQYNPYENQEPVIEREKCDRDRPIEANVTVVDTADGDTIYVKAKKGTYSIRMIGIDTPETHYQGFSQGKWGEEASKRLKEFLPKGTKVRLELSPSVCDSYGRVLAHIFKGKTHVNEELVREGLAVNYCLFPSVAYCEELGEIVGAAMEKRLGMFSDSNVELPYDFRRRISKRPQTSFVGSLLSKKVFRPGHQDRTPVPERIFFQSEESIPKGYEIVN